MKTLIGLLAIIVAGAALLFFSAIFASLAIATANSWVLSGNFSDAWSASWNRIPFTLAWFFVFFVFARVVTNRKNLKK